MKEENTMKKLKNIPKFSTEQEEREFWSKNDSTDYLDWKNSKKVSFPNLKLSTKQLIKANAKQTASFKTLQSKLKITLNQDGKQQSHVVTFRVKKDEILWISATFSVIRAKVTPHKVSFYNKLDNTYFEGDYKYLSDLLGTELDFQKVQNLLIGETLFDLKKHRMCSSGFSGPCFQIGRAMNLLMLHLQQKQI